MEISWLVGTGAALVCGGLCFWVWRARRAGGARESLSGWLIGDEIGGGMGYDSGAGWGDSGGGDAGGDA